MTVQVILLYSIENELRGVEIDRPYHHLIPPIVFPDILHPKHLDFNVKSKEVFWLDLAGPTWHNHVVKKARLHQNSSQVQVILDTTITDNTPMFDSQQERSIHVILTTILLDYYNNN